MLVLVSFPSCDIDPNYFNVSIYSHYLDAGTLSVQGLGGKVTDIFLSFTHTQEQQTLHVIKHTHTKNHN